jgi:hypothetical protein
VRERGTAAASRGKFRFPSFLPNRHSTKTFPDWEQIFALVFAYLSSSRFSLSQINQKEKNNENPNDHQSRCTNSKPQPDDATQREEVVETL